MSKSGLDRGVPETEIAVKKTATAVSQKVQLQLTPLIYFEGPFCSTFLFLLRFLCQFSRIGKRIQVAR